MLKTFLDKAFSFIRQFLVALSFIALVPVLLYLVYYLFFVFSLSRVLGGAIVMVVLLHLNKLL